MSYFKSTPTNLKQSDKPDKDIADSRHTPIQRGKEIECSMQFTLPWNNTSGDRTKMFIFKRHRFSCAGAHENLSVLLTETQISSIAASN